MDQAHSQQAQPSGGIHTAEADPPIAGNIGHQRRQRRSELQHRPPDAGNAPDEFVDQHHRCIQHRSSQAEEDSRQMRIALAQIPHSGDQHDAQGGHAEAEPLLCPHLLPK